MKRTMVTVFALLLALMAMAGLSRSSPITAAPQQSEILEIDVWVSNADSTIPVRRLDPSATQARAVIQSNLRDNDPEQFRVELVDANGVVMFQSGVLQLPKGPHTETIEISGNDVFDGYVNHVSTWKDRLTNAVTQALDLVQASSRTPGEVLGRVDEALATEGILRNGFERLLAFDLSADPGAEPAFQSAQISLDTVATQLNEARNLLQESSIDWNAVEARLQEAENAANDTATQMQTGLDALTEQTRTFPPTGVAGRCNQNTLQLRVGGTDTISGSFWWTVGTPGTPARITNMEEPSTAGNLRAQNARIYSTEVTVPTAWHNTQVEALVLDELCIPVPDTPVQFSTEDPTVITLGASEVTTNADGIALVQVNATADLGEDGTATLVATVDEATATAEIIVIGPPRIISLQLGGSQVARVPNYAIDSTVQVRAILLDENQNDVADGTPVTFSITPNHHSFPDGGQVTTVGGAASATLILGSSTGFYTIEAASGDVSTTQPIRVVGYPAVLEVQANPQIVYVNTPVVDRRSSQITVTVKDSEGLWAPDGTLVTFTIPAEHADKVYFPTLSQTDPGVYEGSILDGKLTAQLIANQTLYARIPIQVTARYFVGNNLRGSADGELTITLRGGKSTFLPFIGKNIRP